MTMDVAGVVRAAREIAGLIAAGWFHSLSNVRHFIQQPDLPTCSHRERTVASSDTHRSLEVMERERQLAAISPNADKLASLIRAGQQRQLLLFEQSNHARRTFIAHLAKRRRTGVDSCGARYHPPYRKDSRNLYTGERLCLKATLIITGYRRLYTTWPDVSATRRQHAD